MKKSISMLLLAAVFLPLMGKDLLLMDKGKSRCVIIKSDATCPVQDFAARELSLFLGKIANGENPVIGQKAVSGKNVIAFQLLKKDNYLKEDGFRLTAKGDTLTISALNKRGLLYGAYEVLKRYGGIRWLYPGPEGEYYKVKPTIAVPEGKYEHNPDFLYRKWGAVAQSWFSRNFDSWTWGVRNNMRFAVSTSILFHKIFHKRLTEMDFEVSAGGHSFGPLVTSTNVPDPVTGKKRTHKEQQAFAEKLFAEHPDYFPLYRGKRMRSFHGGAVPQPCTSNPAVIELFAKNIAYFTENAEPYSLIYDFGNNDTTAWCQCKNCLAQDPKEEKEQGIVSTRYWLFANAVHKRAKELNPNVRLGAWTYQNFSVPPVGVKPDTSVERVMLSNHRRCWRHDLDDKNCPTNQWYYKYNRDWADTKVPLFTYEMNSRFGSLFLPCEKRWVDTIKYYKKNMPSVIGMHTEISLPDGDYNPKRYDVARQKTVFKRMWQSMYLAMLFHWDVNADYDTKYEEANAFYYGKGWQGGIKEFRKYLTKLFMDAPGCWGYGHSTPVGKFLDVPGAKEKLEKYLESAEKAAKNDPDPRALKHVQEEKKFFTETWVKAYNDYINNFREIKAYPLMGKIVIDGKLDERDWKNADTITRFKEAYKNSPVKNQTAVKLAYDKEFIYVGVECLESSPGKMLVHETKHDGEVWYDNDIELFLNDPILGASYFQILINSNGVVCDGSRAPGQKGLTLSWESGIQVATKKGRDRWFLEAKIPARSITGSVLTAGTVLKMNVMRNRKVEGEKGEVTTWSQGEAHSVDVFHAVSFASPRKVSPGNRMEVDTRFWKNGSFNEVEKPEKYYSHWKLKDGMKPKSYSLSGGKQYGGELEMLLHPGSKENYFVRLKSGFIFQEYKFKDDKIKVTFRVRGKGELYFTVLRYAYTPKWTGRGSKGVAKIKVNSPDWKYETFTFERPNKADKKEIHMLMIQAVKGSEIDIDDCYLAGVK